MLCGGVGSSIFVHLTITIVCLYNIQNDRVIAIYFLSFEVCLFLSDNLFVIQTSFQYNAEACIENYTAKKFCTTVNIGV